MENNRIKVVFMNDNKQKKIQEKGITLVALVITIILLLILTGVTLNTALSDNGLFQKAKYAGERYKDSEEKEESTLEDISKEIDKIAIDYNDYVGSYVTEYTPTERTAENPCLIEKETSGYTDQQKFTTENLKWKIWDYDKYTKTIRLISDKPTTQALILKGATGYNNGIWAINEICRQCYGKYDESGKMERGISVANLRKSDIQKVTNYDYTKYSHTATSYLDEENGKGEYKYGTEKTYTENIIYPKIWEQIDKEWKYAVDSDGNIINGEDKEGLIWEKEGVNKYLIGTEEKNTENKFKQSYWYQRFESYDEKDWKSKSVYDMIIDCGGTTYYLASRYTFDWGNRVDFGIQDVHLVKRAVIGSVFYNQGKDGDNVSRTLRPVVSINLISSGYGLEKVEKDGNVSFELKKYN